MVDAVTADGLAGLDGCNHGFFTRRGGVSEGLYTSLNVGLGSHDDAGRVLENRGRALAHLRDGEPATLLTAYQVHSAEVVTVTQPWTPADAPRADAMVTDRPGIALGVLTADCVPVLLADGPARVIGVAHAGWQGALSGVVEAVVAAMVALGAETGRIRAAVGPCIAQASYEVGDDLYRRFVDVAPDAASYFAAGARAGKYQFDLAGLVADRLRVQALDSVDVVAHDTYAREDLFFSYRRTTHRREPDYGRQLSAIMTV